MRPARPGSRKSRLVIAAMLCLFALGLVLAFLWQRPPSAAWLAARVAWEDRWHDPARLRDERPWLARLRGVEGDIAPEPSGTPADHARWMKHAALAAGLSCPVSDFAEREHCEVLKYWLDERVRRLPWLLHENRLDPIVGEHLGFAGLIIERDALPDVRSVEHALRRAEQATRRIDAWTDWFWAQSRAGIRPPHRMLDEVALQITEAYLVDPDQQRLLQAFESSIEPLRAQHAEQVAASLASLREIVRRAHIPAWERLRQAVRDAAAGSPEDFGVWSMPDGDAFYRAALRRHTTLELAPQDVHDFGRAEVARLQGELVELLDRSGVARGRFSERMSRWADAQTGPQRVESPRPSSILGAFERSMKAERERCDPAFASWSEHAVALSTAPADRSRAAPLALYLPRLDGVPVLQLNIRDARDWADWSLGPLVRHEYVPGHHLQWVAQSESAIPTFRRRLNWAGYAEGWAMYAEGVRWDGGEWPQSERIALLHSELLRAVRAVVDPGLHYLRWSRSEAVRYMVEQAAMPQRDAEVEVDRYLAWPGQAVSFAVGLKAFRDARASAQQRMMRLGESGFARAVLQGGAVPLGLLAPRVQAWTAADAGRSAAAP